MSVRTYAILSCILAVCVGFTFARYGSEIFGTESVAATPEGAALAGLLWAAGAYLLLRLFRSGISNAITAVRAAILLQGFLFMVSIGSLVTMVSITASFDVLAAQCLGILDEWEASGARDNACRV